MQNLMVEQRCSKIQGDWGQIEYISGQVHVSACDTSTCFKGQAP